MANYELSSLHAEIIDDIEQLEEKKDPKIPTSSLGTSPKKTVPPVYEQEDAPRLPSDDPIGTSKPVTFEKSEKSTSSKKTTGNGHRRESPIQLQSDGTSTYSRNGSEVRLQKNVVITQDDIRMQSDEARVLFGASIGSGRSSSVKTVEVSGKVNISRFSKNPSERITARSEKAVFDNAEQKVTLDGNARLWKDGHLIKGDRIVYEIMTGMIKVDRAQGVIQPEKASK